MRQVYNNGTEDNVKVYLCLKNRINLWCFSLPGKVLFWGSSFIIVLSRNCCHCYWATVQYLQSLLLQYTSFSERVSRTADSSQEILDLALSLVADSFHKYKVTYYYYCYLLQDTENVELMKYYPQTIGNAHCRIFIPLAPSIHSVAPNYILLQKNKQREGNQQSLSFKL